MNKNLSVLIYWGCLIAIVLGAIAIVVFGFNIAWFSHLAIENIGLPIQWDTVERWQWYCLWALTAGLLVIGLFGLYFLYKAFSGMANADPFDLANSTNLRRFSALLLVQVVAKPVFLVLSGVLLSMNHPAGEKVLYLSFGSSQITTLMLGLILWVLSSMLVAANKLDSENKKFV